MIEHENALEPADQPLNLDEAASYLHLSHSTLYKLVSRRLIAHSKPGGKLLLFFRSDLDDYVRRHRRESIEALVEQHDAHLDLHPEPRLRGRRVTA